MEPCVYHSDRNQYGKIHRNLILVSSISSPEAFFPWNSSNANSDEGLTGIDWVQYEQLFIREFGGSWNRSANSFILVDSYVHFAPHSIDFINKMKWLIHFQPNYSRNLSRNEMFNWYIKKRFCFQMYCSTNVRRWWSNLNVKFWFLIYWIQILQVPKTALIPHIRTWLQRSELFDRTFCAWSIP